MSAVKTPDMQPRSAWQQALQNAVCDVAELADLLDLPVDAIDWRSRAGGDAEPAQLDAGQRFPLRVPRSFISRMRKRDPHDPLLRQVLPQALELEPAAGFGGDPVGEQAQAAGGVVRKYAGRALLIATAACPVHCRYCFRREFPYAAHIAARDGFGAALETLRAAPDVDELILSGGDPLSLVDRKLEALIRGAAALGTLRRIRIHTRYPIVLPERVDAGLVAVLERSALPTIVVVHANHPHEIDTDVAEAFAALRGAGATLLNQSVLLRGVNDDVDTLASLSERLFGAGALPYYLHALDPVRGSAHFALDDGIARDLHAGLRARLPGYLVPRLVREIPREPGKTPLC